MKKIKSLLLVLTSLVLSSCGKSQAKAAPDNLFVPDTEPDTTVYDENIAVDLRKPQFRSGDEEEEEEESFDTDKVVLHYYNEDGKCKERAFYVWVPGIDGQEYSDEYNNEVERVTYSADGTLMTITIDMVNDEGFKPFFGCTSVMYIIKYKLISPANLNWGGQSEDVELKFSEFQPDKDKKVEVWSTPAAGGGIAQFDSEEKTKVEGVKLAKFTDWKTITCTMSANALVYDAEPDTVKWDLYAFDETYFKEKPKKRPAIKKNYKVLSGEASTATFTIPFLYSVHMNVVYCIESNQVRGDMGLKKTVYVSFEDLYGTTRFETYYTPTDVTDLGVTYTPTATTFKVWSPVAANMSLYLYNTDTSAAFDGSDKYKGWHMNYTPGGIWTITVLGDLAHDEYKYFNYYVDTWSTSGVTMDPYATGCGACGIRGLVYDKNETLPEGWNNLETHLPAISSPQELTVYEVQVQDFTGDESWVSSKSPATKRGTYNAFVEKGTRLAADSSITTGFDHLREIKPGAVQFVPVFDSDNDEVKNTKYNWGYNPLNYNCVEGAYSSDPHDGIVRIQEFKNMVNELGKEGMRTIMDVVYNHVSSPTASCFNKLMPRYYFRYSKAGDAEVDIKHWTEPGELYDGSGCHNEFKSEATMARKFIVDSLCMWARDYKIKGFRFDLMGLIDGYTMIDAKKALYEIDPSIYLYGEGWTADRFHGKKTWYDTNGDSVKELVDSFGSFAVDPYDDTGLNTKGGYQVYSELYNKTDHECWLGAFDGSGRDLLKGGDNNGRYAPYKSPNYGFISKTKAEASSSTRNSLQKMIWGQRADDKGGNPKQVVAYASCHDNWTLRDQLYFTLGVEDNSETPLVNEDKAPHIYDVIHATMAVQTFIFATNCAAFMYGGEELMRTKEIIIGDGKNGTVTQEEYDKIPASSYGFIHGHNVSENSYNSPINVNSFKWGNKLSITVDGNTVDMKTENLTAQYANLMALHKEMPKLAMEDLWKIGKGQYSTNGYEIGDASWPGAWTWDDEGAIGIQFDDWFVFIACREFGYLKHADAATWTVKAKGGLASFDSTPGNESINLGDTEAGVTGCASVVYYRGTHA